MEGGGLSVMMGLDRLMLMLLVDNWGTIEPAVIVVWVYQGKGRLTLTFQNSIFSSAIKIVLF